MSACTRLTSGSERGTEPQSPCPLRAGPQWESPPGKSMFLPGGKVHLAWRVNVVNDVFAKEQTDEGQQEPGVLCVDIVADAGKNSYAGNEAVGVFWKRANQRRFPAGRPLIGCSLIQE
jgi:hypothetical protein